MGECIITRRGGRKIISNIGFSSFYRQNSYYTGNFDCVPKILYISIVGAIHWDYGSDVSESALAEIIKEESSDTGIILVRRTEVSYQWREMFNQPCTFSVSNGELVVTPTNSNARFYGPDQNFSYTMHGFAIC